MPRRVTIAMLALALALLLTPQVSLAVDEGKQGHADVAKTHAESALNTLQQAM